MPLRFTHWEQTVEEGVEIVVDNLLQVQGRFAHWTDRAYTPLVVPRNLAGENIELFGFSPQQVFFSSQCRLCLWQFLEQEDLLSFRTTWSFAQFLISIERPREPEAEPELNNRRVTFTFQFLQ